MHTFAYERDLRSVCNENAKIHITFGRFFLSDDAAKENHAINIVLQVGLEKSLQPDPELPFENEEWEDTISDEDVITVECEQMVPASAPAQNDAEFLKVGEGIEAGSMGH
jgi:hypothetical protein